MRVISAFVEIEIGIIVIFEGGNRWNFFVSLQVHEKVYKKKKKGELRISEKIFHLYYSVFLDTFYFYLFKKS